MSRAAIRKPQARHVMEFTTPAPFRGLNDTLPLATMSPEWASVLDNWVAKPEGPTLRQGSKWHATELAEPVTSLITFNGRQTSDNRIFAVAGANLYDVTTPGAIGSADVSGLSTSNVIWQSTQQTYTQSSTNYLVSVNGANDPLLYNGTSWTTCSQTGSPSSPGEFDTVDNNGSAVDISSFNDVLLHQQRLWFVHNTSTKAYYTDIGVVGGDLHAFDFGPLFQRGGYLHKLTTWTMDGGGDSGVQAVLVAISSKGDVVLFQGNDPSDAATWGYKGTWQLGSPLGKRCTLQYQGDVLYLSTDGLYPLSKYLRSSRADDTASLTYPISNTLNQLIALNGELSGWDLAYFPGQNILVLNVPQAGGTTNFQFVMNTISGGWSRFIGWAAQSWAMFNDRLYFGSLDAVQNAFYGAYQDGANYDGEDGASIVAMGLSGFSTFPDQGLDGITKSIVQIRPFMVVRAPIEEISVGVNVDFQVDYEVAPGPAPILPAASGVWGSGLWDSMYWSSGGLFGDAYFPWFTVFAPPAMHVAAAVSVTAQNSVIWSKSQWRVKAGYEQ